MSKPRLTLDTEDHHTGFSRAFRPADLFLHLGDKIEVFNARYNVSAPGDVVGFDGDLDEYVLVRVDWEDIYLEELALV